MEEKVDLIDEDNNVIGETTREEVIAKNLLHRAAIIVICNEKGEFFVQKRSNDKKLFPGYWGIGCGGSVSKGESFDEAAQREMMEELGIDAPPIFVKQVNYEGKKTRYIANLYCIEYDGEITFNDGEVQDGKFVREAELLRMIDEEDFLPDDVEVIVKNFDEIKDILER
ncbi:NUDIX domain-containing protein [Candidatus Woesearchaeota archaeon]|nr:NUDIX domain-containing protein [Candidatus Woesearchaeota archaeon]